MLTGVLLRGVPSTAGPKLALKNLRLPHGRVVRQSPERAVARRYRSFDLGGCYGYNALVLAKLPGAPVLSVQLAVVTAVVQSHSAGPTWLARLALTTLGPLLAVAIAPKDIRWASLRPLLPRK
ncbi:MAG: hypothetical protein ACXVXN_06640 [Mycobacteriaceae bacterium]